jgi:ElaB/YqjD/DUF883 family membrane-anchored ribosome-binding protein
MAQKSVTKDQLMQEYNSVVSETEQLLKSVGTAGSEGAQQLRASVEQSLNAAKDRLAQLQRDIADRSRAAAQATEEYVQENPWQSVGAAAAIGALAGLVAGILIARR